ncbi:pyruvate transporter 0 [Trypanosoma rangeli]|uniref:Pyruvate transporter 0 n=1 Tax=Trypanosoma rangeli TaxID=5698 RepID=A0A3R7R443_TRYRA|nr:pyruvate transporter 0 [Trypanosoma rangeli]RNE95767.1 pyruvate transporter 0 [Trypanosoma rangeli]|eukprot:RNE95767.1 pyruvate transporter 0 [Trypanosoma rangeli]
MVLQVDDLFRMRMLMAGVYVGLSISSTYGFSLFTDHLKTKYGYSQSDITTISTVGNVVNFVNLHGGALFDSVGPTVALPFAGVLGGLGFLMFGLTFDGTVKTSSVALFSLYQGITHLGLPIMDVCSMMTLMLHFPLDRGYVVLIMKTFNGLGTAVLMAYFNGWFRAADFHNSEDNNYSGYAYFVAAQIFFCSCLGAYCTRLPMYFPCTWRKKRLSAEELAEREKTLDLYMSQHAPSRRLYIGFGLVVVMLIFSATQSITTAYVKTSHAGYVAISIVALLLMAAFSLMAVPFQFLGRYNPVRPTRMAGIGEVATETAPEQTDGAVGANEMVESNASHNKQPAKVWPQYKGSFWSHLLSFHMWAMWFTCFGMWGTGPVMQMNVAQISRSTNYGVYDSRTLTLYIAIMSVGTAIGRISVGYFDTKLTAWNRAGKTRILTTIALPIAPLLFAVAYLFFGVVPGNALLLPFLLGSFGNGIAWGIGIIVSRMMYAKDIGKHYSFLRISAAVASIALNRFLFGGMYDAEGRRRGELPSCNAPSCVRKQMFILMAINLLSTCVAVLVHWRFSRFTQAKLAEEASSANEKADVGAAREEPSEPALKQD